MKDGSCQSSAKASYEKDAEGSEEDVYDGLAEFTREFTLKYCKENGIEGRQGFAEKKGAEDDA